MGELLTDILGLQHPDTLIMTSMGNLAASFSDPGQHTKADEFKERCREVVELRTDPQPGQQLHAPWMALGLGL